MKSLFFLCFILAATTVASSETLFLKNGGTIDVSHKWKEDRDFIGYWKTGETETFYVKESEIDYIKTEKMRIEKAKEDFSKSPAVLQAQPDQPAKTEHPPAVITSGGKYELVSINYEWDYGNLYVIGEIKNNGDTPGGPKLEVIVRDKNGILIDSTQFWPNSTVNIQPGSSCGIKHPVTKKESASKMEVKVISENVWK